MIKVYTAESVHRFDHGWLKGSHIFSFGEYYDPANTAFGPMRVCNDDTIAPGKGFGAHPHSDMEIVSIILSGVLRHEDNLGNVAESSFGGIQRMSAGTGVIHTEHNPSKDEPARLLQLWFMPSVRGSRPSYQAGKYWTEKLDGALVPVVSAEGSDEIVDIGQDMTIYLGRLRGGQNLAFHQEPGRRIFVYVIEGSLEVSGSKLNSGDSARIEDEDTISLAATESAFVMLVDLP
ncbi:pirin family protein [Paenibacillus sp. URB8-2]|uniref:pirin family protein n=1 Tax=Paenibacillus sp. URB8-2 TaxID=2741301 RepID=UPI0015BD4A73|nr:pirin family protein [Paenibacillus sp. URB8-2]BCG57578.1 quercetin 2,3-dioxygenase [Paenibacillus sp. URB8-2]